MTRLFVKSKPWAKVTLSNRGFQAYKFESYFLKFESQKFGFTISSFKNLNYIQTLKVSNSKNIVLDTNAFHLRPSVVRVPSVGVPLSSGCVLLTSTCVRSPFSVPRSPFPVHRSPFIVQIWNLIFYLMRTMNDERGAVNLKWNASGCQWNVAEC